MTSEYGGMKILRLFRLGLPWAALAVVIFGIGAALGWAILGSPTQRLDTSRIIYGQPVQLMHDQMHYRTMSGLVPTLVDGTHPAAEVPVGFHNFRKLSASQVASWSFEVVNSGDADLIISSGFTTCGCTTAELSTATIPPGKSSLVTITFDASHATVGSVIRRGVILETNDPQQPQVELWVQASIVK